jgi:hypothetical protein
MILAVAFVAVGVTLGDAEATTLSCSITEVAWHPTGGGTLQLYCGGVWYYGFGTDGNCPTADADTRKAWLSLAQSGLLAGKTLTLDYTACTGGPGLTNVRLNQ